MFANDAMSQWLGITCSEMEEGRCIITMQVRKEMLNGFYIAHGGITYSLADSAFAFASNSHGRKAVSIETSISHTKAVQEGDQLTARAELEHLSNKIGVYNVKVSNQKNEVVALFKGTVYRTGQLWFEDDI